MLPCTRSYVITPPPRTVAQQYNPRTGLRVTMLQAALQNERWVAVLVTVELLCVRTKLVNLTVEIVTYNLAIS